MVEHNSNVTLVAAAALTVALAMVARPGFAAEALPKLGADLAATSVSGLSSGAFMAVQIEVAHSKDIVGAGIVAGGPYACAESQGEPAGAVLAVGGAAKGPTGPV